MLADKHVHTHKYTHMPPYCLLLRGSSPHSSVIHIRKIEYSCTPADTLQLAALRVSPDLSSVTSDLWGPVLCVQEYSVPSEPAHAALRLSGGLSVTCLISSCSASSEGRCRTADPPSSGRGAWGSRWPWPSESGLAPTSCPGSPWAEGRPGGEIIQSQSQSGVNG